MGLLTVCKFVLLAFSRNISDCINFFAGDTTITFCYRNVLGLCNVLEKYLLQTYCTIPVLIISQTYKRSNHHYKTWAQGIYQLSYGVEGL